MAIILAVQLVALDSTAQVPLRRGDLDADNQPTVVDLQRLINHINGQTLLAPSLLPYGDLNEDGQINEVDLQLLRSAILGIAPLPNPYAAPVVSTPDGPANVDVGIGNNGTYERSLVPLTPGTNLITVIAGDAFGSSASKSITLNYQPLALNQPRLIAVSGDMQMTNVHRRLAQPIVVRATQADGVTPFANKLVTLEVTRSDGRLLPVDLNAAADPSALTNDITRTVHGVMHVQLFTDAGQNIVEATFPGNPGLPATFIAYGVARGPAQPTRLSGLVLDNTSSPIGGAACSLSVGGEMFSTATDPQGQFHFDASTLPSGPAFLTVNGLTATNLLGRKSNAKNHALILLRLVHLAIK